VPVLVDDTVVMRCTLPAVRHLAEE
jgi:hypothetical protein